MTTLETAIEFGVVTPETSEKLNWEKPTMLQWAWSDNEVMLVDCNDYDYISLHNVSGLVPYDKLIPAPQMHEIAPLLPMFIVCITGEHYIWNKVKHEAEVKDKIETFYLTLHSIEPNSEYQLIYENPTYPFDLGSNYCQHVFNNHFTEAYAQMYLKLKKEGLI